MGFIAVALVYFGGWRPLGIMGGALLFSTVNALQLWMQVLGVSIPSDVAVMLPYLLTIVALAFTVRPRAPAGGAEQAVRARGSVKNHDCVDQRSADRRSHRTLASHLNQEEQV